MSDPRDLIGAYVRAVHGWNRQSFEGEGTAVAYSEGPQYLIETAAGRQFWWREHLVDVVPEEARKSTPLVSDEIPDQVTLEDLPAVEFPDPDGNWTVCYRCGGLVMDDALLAGRGGHERWHAAIENAADPRLSALRRAELDQFLKTMPVESAGASASTQTEQPAGEFTPLRSRLEAALDHGINPEMTNREVTDQVLMPVVEAWCEKYVEQYADRARDAEAADFRRQGELQRANDLVDELRKQIESLSQASQGQRRDLRTALGVTFVTTWSQLIRLVGQQREYVDVLERKNRDCAEKHTPVFDPDLPHTAEALSKVINTVRQELGHALQVDPSKTPFNEMVDLVAELDAFRRNTSDESEAAPHEWTSQHMANVLTQQGAALERLRDVVRAAGCPVDADVIDWIEKQLTGQGMLLWLHAEATYKLALPCGSCHPCANWSDETWRRADRKPPHVHEWDEAQAELRARREHECAWTTDQVNARVDERRAGIIELLELAARGRDWYGNGRALEKDRLAVEAETFRNAANLVRDPSRIYSFIPTSMILEVGKLADPQRNAEVLTDQMLTNMLCLVGVTPTPAQLAMWTPEQREQAANWAGLVHLSASDNNVDVPECPGFLVPDRFPGVVNVRSLKDTEDVWVCSRCEQRTGMMGHPNGCPEPAAEQPSEVCPSLYPHNGQLLNCAEDTGYSHTHNRGDITWSDAEAVPVPWPLDQEPPAGIDTLRDTGDIGYLCRMTDGWAWWSQSTLPKGDTSEVDSETHEWATAVLDVDGDLHVVRPE